MRILLPLLFAALTTGVHAQDLRIYGTTSSGGAHGKGVVYRVNGDGSDFSVVQHLDDATGHSPTAGLCWSNGMLYGCTAMGGDGTLATGTVFRVDPATDGFEVITDLGLEGGGIVHGTLVAGNDGMLYGAGYAGSDGGGAIFRIDPADGTYAELYALDQATDGGAIEGPLLEHAPGVFYGAASQGGANNESGTLFRFELAGNTFTKLHDFNGNEGGRTPYSGLCDGMNGWLYGTTFEGGTDGKGILYRLRLDDGTFEKLLDLADVDGANCWATLTMGSPGSLVGAAANGGLNSGGFLFTLSTGDASFTDVHDCSVATGSGPMGGLVHGTSTLLFGHSLLGGAGAFGVLYRYETGTDQYTVVHAFSGPDGSMPRGEPVPMEAPSGVTGNDAPSFTLGPNPTDSDVTLRREGTGTAQLRITDALGRTLQHATLTRPTTVLHLDGAPGLRFITLSDAHGARTERVLVR